MDSDKKDDTQMAEEWIATSEAAEEASQRHDTIVPQLTRQLENQQKLLEYHQELLWRRWFRKRKKPEDEIR